MDAATGEALTEIELPRAPVQDGIAIDSGRIFLCLCDGAVLGLK